MNSLETMGPKFSAQVKLAIHKKKQLHTKQKPKIIISSDTGRFFGHVANNTRQMEI